MGQTGVIGIAETVFASNWWIVVQMFKSGGKHLGIMGIGDNLGVGLVLGVQRVLLTVEHEGVGILTKNFGVTESKLEIATCEVFV